VARGESGCAADSFGTPHPGYFAKRVWICLIAKELTFSRVQKSLQEYQTMRFRAGATRGVGEALSR